MRRPLERARIRLLPVNRDLEPPRLRIVRPQERWAKLALYAGLLLIVGWLYFSSANIGPANRDRVGDPAVSTDERAERASEVQNDARKRQDGLQNGSGDHRSSGSGRARNKTDDTDASNALLIRDVRVTNEDDEVVYRGDINLAPTLQRIERGKRLRFSHDGITFENRERRLPAKRSGYYHEFIHPTLGEDGPGGQRVVLGENGEVYYTPDHYRTFRRVR